MIIKWWFKHHITLAMRFGLFQETSPILLPSVATSHSQERYSIKFKN